MISRAQLLKPGRSLSIFKRFTASVSIPKMQWGAQFTENKGPINLVEIPVPEPNDEQVLVNIKYSGVCHTDLHAWNGDWPLANKLPLVGGHEGAGIAVKVGRNVKGVSVGDRVGIKWLNGSCGTCEFCRRSCEPNCGKAELSGYTIDGTFQEYALGQGSQVAHIPDSVPLDVAAPILCAGLTVYKGLKESEVKPGQWVCISGAGGGLGHLAVQYAKAMGMRVVAIDHGEDKKKLCTDLGAESFIDFAEHKDIVKAVQDATEGGPHGSLVLATNIKAFSQACEYARAQGSIVTISLPAEATLQANMFWFTVKCLKLKGSYVGNREDTAEALDFVARGLVKPIMKVEPFSSLTNVYKQMEEGTLAGRIVLDLSRK